MTKDEALNLALDAFGEIAWSNETQWQRDRAKEAIIAIKEALAQPEYQSTADKSKLEKVPAKGALLAQPEHEWVRGECVKCGQSMEQPEQEPVAWAGVDFDIKTTPPQRTWVGLTDEEVNKLVDDEDWYNDPHEFSRIVEAKIRGKNDAS